MNKLKNMNHTKRRMTVVGLFCFAAAMSLFAGCSANLEKLEKSPEYRESHMFYMDTVIDMRLYGNGITDEIYQETESVCGQIIGQIESQLSRTVKDSPVAKLNAFSADDGNNLFPSPKSAALGVLEEAFYISEITGGAYNPTLGVLTDLWNITGIAESGSEVIIKIPEDSEITEALTHTGTEKFKISPEGIYKFDSLAKIDLGGIGKGYAADKVIEYLKSAELEYGLISMGGNIGVFGEKPDGELFKIGIRHPDNAGKIAGYLYIKSGFVSVSGDYERYIVFDGKRYHHIFDPKTGYPSDSGLRSVAVWSQNGMYADALSTALFVMGSEKGLDFYSNSGSLSRSSSVRFEAVFMTSSGEIILTDGLKHGSLFEEISDSGYTLIK